MSDALKPIIAAAADRALSNDEAETAFDMMFDGQATQAQTGGLLMAMRTRGEVRSSRCATSQTG